jgi:hypothetical protein
VKRFLAAALIAAACSRAPRYVPVHSPLGYSVEVPEGWRSDADPIPDRKPATSSFFVGRDQPQIEGRPMGAVLSIGRFMRRRADIPGTEKAFKAYEAGFLKPTIALFGDDKAAAAAKPYARRYEEGESGGGFHGNSRLSMRVEGVAFRRPDAYFLIECRSTVENVELCRAALDHAVKSFTPPAR